MASRRVIGIDAGGTRLRGGVVDEDLRVHARVQRTWAPGDRASVLDRVVEEVEAALAVAPEADAVGFGVPAIVDRDRAVTTWSDHPPFRDLPFRDLMSERLGLPVVVENDAHAALLAEHAYGAARGASDALMLTLGTGISGAVLAAARIYRGATGAAGELGHVVVDRDGPPCVGSCPNRGCLNVMASGAAIGREGEAAAVRAPDSALAEARDSGRPLTAALVTELAHAGDEVACDVLASCGRHLGVGLASLVNVFAPEAIVIGGGVIGADEMLLAPAREEMAARVLPPGRDVRVVRAHFGEEAGMLGAALLALGGASAS